MNCEDAITVLGEDAQKVYDEIFDKMGDSEVLEKWLQKRKVHLELYIYTGETDWQDLVHAGANLYQAAVASNRKVFRSDGDEQSVLLFLAKSETQILKLLREFRDEYLVCHEVLTS